VQVAQSVEQQTLLCLDRAMTRIFLRVLLVVLELTTAMLDSSGNGTSWKTKKILDFDLVLKAPPWVFHLVCSSFLQWALGMCLPDTTLPLVPESTSILSLVVSLALDFFLLKFKSRSLIADARHQRQMALGTTALNSVLATTAIKRTGSKKKDMKNSCSQTKKKTWQQLQCVGTRN
jgi:hypothetical protein